MDILSGMTETEKRIEEEIDFENNKIIAKIQKERPLFNKDNELVISGNSSRWEGFEKREDGIYKVKTESGEYITEKKVSKEEVRKELSIQVEKYGIDGLPRFKIEKMPPFKGIYYLFLNLCREIKKSLIFTLKSLRRKIGIK